MASHRDETRIYNKNKFKLGLFGMNCLGGLSLTKAPQRSLDRVQVSLRVQPGVGRVLVDRGERNATDSES